MNTDVGPRSFSNKNFAPVGKSTRPGSNRNETLFGLFTWGDKVFSSTAICIPNVCIFPLHKHIEPAVVTTTLDTIYQHQHRRPDFISRDDNESYTTQSASAMLDHSVRANAKMLYIHLPPLERRSVHRAILPCMSTKRIHWPIWYVLVPSRSTNISLHSDANLLRTPLPTHLFVPQKTFWRWRKCYHDTER